MQFTLTPGAFGCILETHFDLDGDPVVEEIIYHPECRGWDPSLTHAVDLQREQSDSESTDNLSSYGSQAETSPGLNDSDLDP